MVMFSRGQVDIAPNHFLLHVEHGDRKFHGGFWDEKGVAGMEEHGLRTSGSAIQRT
jgi:hypothetical protein